MEESFRKKYGDAMADEFAGFMTEKRIRKTNRKGDQEMAELTGTAASAADAGARKEKRVSDSYTECTHCVLSSDINGTGRLFGGKMMEMMDQAAGICAMRHCGGPVTTAAVDGLQFKRGAMINDIVIAVGHITYVGRSSMEVRVDVYVEDIRTGMRYTMNRAYFTEVATDENGHPVPVPYGLLLETETQKAEWEGALRRKEMAKKRRAEGY